MVDCLKFFIFSLLVVGGAAKHDMLEYVKQRNFPLGEAALCVIKRHISPHSSTLVIMERCQLCTNDQQTFQSQLLNYILLGLDTVMALQLYVGTPDEHPWDYNVFIVDSWQAFIELRFHFPNTQHEREFYFLILLTIKMENGFLYMQMMKQIFLSCLNFNVLNVIIMIEEADRSVALYNYLLFGPHCDQIILVRLVNRFANGRLKQNELFPQRRLNLYGCGLNISARFLPPFFMYDGPKRALIRGNINPNDISGIDGDLLKILANVLNFKIQLIIPRDRSEIIGPKNSTGCFAMLSDGDADIAVGGFSGADYQRSIYSPTSVYHQSYFVFVVRTDSQFGRISHLRKPLRDKVWAAVLVTLAIAVLTIQLMKYKADQRMRFFVFGAHNRAPVENLFVSFLGNPISTHRLPGSPFGRFLLASWLVLTLILRNAYQGQMFDVLRVARRTRLPESFNDLRQNNYTLISNEYSPFYPRDKTIVIKGVFLTRYQILEQTMEHRLATISLLYSLAYYNRLYHKSSKLTYVPQPIYLNQVVMYFRKHSILRSSFDRKIEQLVSAGILSHIERQYVLKRFIHMNEKSRVVPKLRNDTIYGLYYTYFILLGVSLLVMVLELVSVHSPMLRCIFEDWL